MNPLIQDLVADALTGRILETKPRGINVLRHPGKVSVLIGMRRSGKTWLCFSRMRELLGRGIDRSRLLYLNFEDDRWASLAVSDLQWITEAFYSLHPENLSKTCYFFFDEIQNVPGWEAWVRRLQDGGRVELTVTGSSSRFLSKEIGTSLRGRGLVTEVFPLSFREHCLFRGIKLPVPSARPIFDARLRAVLRKNVDEYRIVGGFPEVQAMSREIREATLQEYVSAVIYRDVIERCHVRNGEVLRMIVRQLLRNPATLLSVSKLWQTFKSQGMNVTKSTLFEMLADLNDAYFCHLVEISSSSVRVRQTNPRKAYVADMGLVNAFLTPSEENSALQLENLAYLHLRRQGLHPCYGRTHAGYEIDFVVDRRKGRELVQSCWSLSNGDTAARELRALVAARREFRAEAATIVTWNDLESEHDHVRIVPFWRWAMEAVEK